VNKLTAKLGTNLKGKRFAMWGLAFKPNTDDMREAPSRAMLEALWGMGATVAAYDPAAMEETHRVYGDRADLTLVDSPMAALEGADALLIVTEWKVFRSPNFDAMKSLLKSPLVFDGRNLYEPQAMRDLGFEYFPIGRQ
jgi:UDPglucose 6-dehydrogenase